MWRTVREEVLLREARVHFRRPVATRRADEEGEDDDHERRFPCRGCADGQDATDSTAAGPERTFLAVVSPRFEEAVEFQFEGGNQRAEDYQRRDDTDRTHDTEVLNRWQGTDQIREETDDRRRGHPRQGRTDADERDAHRPANVLVGVRLPFLTVTHEDVNRVVDRLAR